jgi:hypothetical protein
LTPGIIIAEMRYLISLALVGFTSTQSAYALSEAGVPQYVLDYGKTYSSHNCSQCTNSNPIAPLVWLHSQETYMPSDLQQQLDNTVPKVNWTSIEGVQSPLDLNNLDTLNDLGNTSVYLTSLNGIDASPQPTWLQGITPDEDGRIGDGTGSAIIVADRGNETVDAFYFYFYA